MSPIVDLPNNYEVYDFSRGYNPNRRLQSPFGIGKYNEKRPSMYQGELYKKGQRNIHMGIDIGAPVGTEVMNFFEGQVFDFTYHEKPWDYGYTLITKHVIKGQVIYALYGHLSGQSIRNKTCGESIKAGEVIAWVGDKHENGGWNPHVHFQLSLVEPVGADMPGVVSENQLADALGKYPDPRIVLGELYK